MFLTDREIEMRLLHEHVEKRRRALAAKAEVAIDDETLKQFQEQQERMRERMKRAGIDPRGSWRVVF